MKVKSDQFLFSRVSVVENSKSVLSFMTCIKDISVLCGTRSLVWPCMQKDEKIE